MNRSPLPWLLLAALLAHGMGLAGGFVYDDHRFVEHNDALALARPSQLLLDPSTHTVDADRDVYRPVRALTHAIDRRRWGLEPFGFHLHSLLVHLANVALAWIVVRRLLPDAGDAPPLLASLTLAVHPLGVEAVGWISSRGDLYAVGFGLLALGLVGVPRRDDDGPGLGALAGGLLAAAVATLAKESALVLPLVAWAQVRGVGARPRRGVVALAIGVGLALGLRQVALAGASPVQTAPHGGSWVSQAGWALFGYGVLLRHLVWPAGLSVEYPQEAWAAAGGPWSQGPTWIALLVPGLAVLALRRRPSRQALFLLGWALLAYLPSSSLLVTLRSLVADRYAYPVLVPAGALAGVGVATLARRFAATGAGRTHTPPAALVGAALALTLTWAPLARAHTADFADDAALWRSVLAGDGGSVRAHLGLAAAEEDHERVREHLDAAVREAGGRSDGRLLAVALAERGRFALRIDRDTEEAIRRLSAALLHLRQNRDRVAPAPEEAGVVVDLAEALALAGRDGDAAQVLGEALAQHLGVADRVSLAPLMFQRARLAMRFAAGIDTPEAWAAAETALIEAETTAPEHPGIEELRRVWDRRGSGSDDAQLSSP